MTFDISVVSASERSPFKQQSRCFCCNEELKTVADGPIVSYDAWPTADVFTRVFMHRDCAFAMAQRLICDAWPNRRAGDVLMKNDR